MKRMIITPMQLNEVLSADYNTPELKKVQRRIYKSVSDYCGKMHSDSAWQDVKTLIEMIRSVNGVEDVTVGAGEYSNFTNPEKGTYRDYEITVDTQFGRLYGYIRCHAAGTMDDIFKYYDMTISLYPDKKRDMEERLGEISEAASKIIPSTAGEAQSTAQSELAKDPNSEVTINITDSTPGAENKTGYAQSTASTNPQQIKNFGKMTFAATSNNGNIFEGTKRQVELGRMLEMRKKGKIYSKKQLDEMFMGNNETLVQKIKRASVFNLLDAVLIAFGEDAREEMDDAFERGEDMVQWVMNLMNNATPEEKEEFLSELN